MLSCLIAVKMVLRRLIETGLSQVDLSVGLVGLIYEIAHVVVLFAVDCFLVAFEVWVVFPIFEDKYVKFNVFLPVGKLKL